MKEVSGPVIAIALILAAVFVPTAFIPGITGRLYLLLPSPSPSQSYFPRSMRCHLSPALSALLLRPKKEARGPLVNFSMVQPRVWAGHRGLRERLRFSDP